MTRVLLGLIVSGAAAAAMLAIATLVVAILWRTGGAGAVTRLSPRVRARLLEAWRLLPAAAAVASLFVTLAAFLRYEPVDARESLGVLLPALCVATIVSAAAGLLRLGRASRRANQTISSWNSDPAGTAHAMPVIAVDVPFPLVAVVGVWKPRLLVAREVLARCDRSEVEAMIAHEAAHVAERDNLTRLLFAAAPVLPFTSRVLDEIERAWVIASEEAADDAARRDERAAMALASALIKVARLAIGPAPLKHASAILSGSEVEHRVRRLLQPAPRPAAIRRRITWPILAALTGIAACWPPVLGSAYELAEYCVRHLP